MISPEAGLAAIKLVAGGDLFGFPDEFGFGFAVDLTGECVFVVTNRGFRRFDCQDLWRQLVVWLAVVV